ncbi:MAG TPA: alpha/beta hydrolase [Rhizomicrobium sp.]|jgi:pimeloyl-ACP methyl ester carboxylesterase|nr:alpha/beta hydrolase [Rhizomicrobium sp.]
MRAFLIFLVVAAALLAGAFYAFSEPDIPRSVLEMKYGAPASDFMMLPDGARAHVRDQGNKAGSPLVLVHGSNASFVTWEPWVKRLGDTYRVISIDMPGHGLTGAVPNHDYSQEGMVKFVKEVTDRLALTTFAIAGNSMGGGIAARFAEEHPGNVTHLILVDAAGMPTKEGSNIPLAFKLARVPVVNQILLHITPRSLVTEGLNDAVIHKEIITDKMIDSYWDFARMTGTRQATLERFNLPWTNDVATHIADIKAPTLILWGAEDHLIPVEAAGEFHRAIPGSILIVYPAKGHVPQEEVADRSAADVRAFLK